MVAVEVAQLPCPGLDDLPLDCCICVVSDTVAPGDGVDGGGLGVWWRGLSMDRSRNGWQAFVETFS